MIRDFAYLEPSRREYLAWLALRFPGSHVTTKKYRDAAAARKRGGRTPSPVIAERNADIVRRNNAGERAGVIAQSLQLTEGAVRRVIAVARERGVAAPPKKRADVKPDAYAASAEPARRTA